MFSAMLTFTACGGNEDEPNPIDPLKVSFNESDISMTVGETFVLFPTVESGIMDIEKAIWRSSNNKVASVSEGTISANAVGKTDILLLYEGDIVALCRVTVVPVEASAISLNYYSLSMSIGETTTLTATVEPQEATGYRVVWETSDATIATVSECGVISALSIGETTITASIAGTTISNECIVTVTPKAVTGIVCQDNVALLKGESIKIEASVIPIDATNTTLIWTSSNPAVATVDDDGNVRGLSIGNAQISVRSDDGGFEGLCSVEVYGIDKQLTISSEHGSEGSTVSGFYSYLKLTIRTNSNQSILITSILVLDNDNICQYIDAPNIKCYEYTNKYITVYHGTTWEDTFKAKGWKFLVTYTWDGMEYEAIHVHW